jgi:hypothetical protein
MPSLVLGNEGEEGGGEGRGVNYLIFVACGKTVLPKLGKILPTCFK